MASSQTINSFACDVFLFLWKYERLDISQASSLEFYRCQTRKDLERPMVNALKLRLVFFRIKMTRDLEDNYAFYESNHSDFQLYLLQHMKRYFPYPCMSVFDKLLMSCVVVTLMAGICYKKKNNVYQIVGAQSWAMYFKEEHGEEFFGAGGFDELLKYVSKYHNQFKWDVFDRLDSDIKKAKAGFEHFSKDYNMRDILKLFKERKKNHDQQCCSNCFPLFDVLNSLICKSLTKIGDFQLIEGYLQLFHRVDAASRLTTEADIKNQAATYQEEKAEVVQRCKSAITELLQKNIFPSSKEDGSLELLANNDYESCILCGKDRNKKCVPYVKSVFCRIAFEREDEEINDGPTLKAFLTLGAKRDQNEM